MFDIETVKSTPGKMEVRKELRMHREDEALIRFAASATGLRESDFVRRAAIMHAREIKRRMSLSVLPSKAFNDFKAAVEAPGKSVSGLKRAFEASKSLLKNAR